MSTTANGTSELKQRKINGHAETHNVLEEKIQHLAPAKSSSGSPQSVANFVICVGGIYASFITWGILQERITTTNYGTAASPEKFTSPVVVNTVQSIFAATLGYIYLLYTRSRDSRAFPIFPTREILLPMLMVALTSSLASPFGYASLKYVDYITFTLAKSCKLLPVMFLHVVLFGKRYPWHKYVVVLLVTAGVAVFTLHHPSTAKKTSSSSSGSNSSILGLTLLAINLLFDGLTNTTQDHIYKAFRPYTGQQMMCGLNIMATVLTTTYLMFEPFLAVTDVGAFFGMKGGKGELSRALEFVGRHPGVGWDVLGFAACGALGQVFIFYTLSTFGSLLLVMVTVTRKMLTMLISVFWFGHQLSSMQWLGVGLVFGGVAVEAQLSNREKAGAAKAKSEALKSAAALK